MEEELRHYHPRGVEIVGAFVEGINAYVAQALANPELLSVEFGMLGIEPGFWTPEVVISRHPGLLANIGSELRYGRAVAALGPEAVKSVATFRPSNPDLSLDPAIDGRHLQEHDILHLYNAFRGSVRFQPEDVGVEYRREAADWGSPEPADPGESGLAGWDEAAFPPSLNWDPESDLGSNNWLVAGNLSASGFPIMANDPHRSQAAPSLRYWVHLVGPGWDVIGGGEPSLPGISIGHNEYGAWGLTVFSSIRMEGSQR